MLIIFFKSLSITDANNLCSFDRAASSESSKSFPVVSNVAFGQESWLLDRKSGPKIHFFFKSAFPNSKPLVGISAGFSFSPQ